MPDRPTVMPDRPAVDHARLRATAPTPAACGGAEASVRRSGRR